MIKALIINRLSKLPDELTPIRDVASSRIDKFSRIDDNGTIEIEHTPELFPESYSLRLFAASSLQAINRFHSLYDIQIPELYQRFLLYFNGIHFKELALYGLPVSMYEAEIRQIDRKKVQPYDLGAANMYWKIEYLPSNSDSFHFGSTMQSEVNFGYIMNVEGKIQKLKHKIFEGKTKNQLATRKEKEAYKLLIGELINEWDDFSLFLSTEINQVLI